MEWSFLEILLPPALESTSATTVLYCFATAPSSTIRRQIPAVEYPSATVHSSLRTQRSPTIRPASQLEESTTAAPSRPPLPPASFQIHCSSETARSPAIQPRIMV